MRGTTTPLRSSSKILLRPTGADENKMDGGVEILHDWQANPQLDFLHDKHEKY